MRANVRLFHVQKACQLDNTHGNIESYKIANFWDFVDEKDLLVVT